MFYLALIGKKVFNSKVLMKCAYFTLRRPQCISTVCTNALEVLTYTTDVRYQ